MTKILTRRRFLETSAATAAVGWASARSYATDGDKSGPNDTVRLGLIGCGERGSQLLDGLAPLAGVRVAAVCDVNASRLVPMRAKAGGNGVAAYQDFRKLLDDKNIDAVLVATTGHWKALCAVNACRAGKDVYTEKPLATSIGEGRAIVEAARKHNRIVQIGTQQHSADHYRKAAEIVQSGALGQIGEVKVWDYINQNPGIGAPPDAAPPEGLDWDFWLGPAPKVPFNPNRYAFHYWFFDYGGAWATDWAVHHYDIVHWAMGAQGPQSACAGGGRYCFAKENDYREWPDTFSGTLEYGPCPAAERGFVLQYTSRAGNSHERCPASNGKCFYGTDGTLLVHRGGFWLSPEIRASRKIAKQEVVGNHDATSEHLAAFLRHIRDRTQPETDSAVGHRASIPGHLMNIAWRVGRNIRWDADAEHIPDDPEANALLARTYRAPWKLDM